MAKRPSYWTIAYIDSKKLGMLERDLSKHPKYRLVRAYVPRIKILKKKFKGKDHFDEVPLLFNYGFFEVPEYFIPNPHFLEMMSKDINCIYAWVKDIAIDPKRNNPNKIALAKESDIAALIKQQNHESIYSRNDIDNLTPGKIIKLEGYPFEGLTAEVIKVDKQKKEVEVKLLLDTFIKTIKVSFDNIFYTIYKSQYMNTEMKERSLDEMGFKQKNIDYLFNKQ
jgi:transcription antitermination factor NusG